jgi:hypothetical protein
MNPAVFFWNVCIWLGSINYEVLTGKRPGQRKRLTHRVHTAPGQRKRPRTASTQPLSLQMDIRYPIIGETMWFALLDISDFG